MKFQKTLRITIAIMLIAAMSLSLAACGSKDAKDSAGDSAPAATDSVPAASDSAAPADSAALPTITPGKLTIATGEPAWAPWVLEDNPESGQGYEAAVAYAVAEKLGFAKEDVVWVRADFDASIQPGPKDFDFNIQQYDITEERKESVDFSSSYYKGPLVIVTKKDGKFGGAKSIAELKDALFGAASGDIAVQYTEDKIAPAKEVQIFENLSDVFAALENNQIDCTIIGLLTGDYVVNIEQEQITNGVILGAVEGSESATEGLGLLLPKGSPLTAEVTKAVDALRDEGVFDKFKTEWLGDLEVSYLK